MKNHFQERYFYFQKLFYQNIIVSFAQNNTHIDYV